MPERPRLQSSRHWSVPARAARRHPFHLAFLVTDLASTRRFYRDLLGCREGRSARTWVDFDFFGNQISAHVSGEAPQQLPCGHVDSVTVPVPHFGAIVPRPAFERLARRLEAAKVGFVIQPQVRYAGRPSEQATMFFADPSGNAIEIKSFRDPRQVFRR